mmetsp:Transcript_9611/g.13613  ORF Transcript_9611/g.13613 Transcript_9611/m.13613 type:complete len:223 (-) Transcript_9611:1662-2330(-)
MAVLSTPLILAGFKFVTQAIFRPTKLSMDIFPARPATTVLASPPSSPQSTLQTSRLLAPGCCEASNTVPARKATRRTSSITFDDACAPLLRGFEPFVRLSGLLSFDTAHVSLKVTTRLKVRLSIPDDCGSSAKYPFRSNWYDASKGFITSFSSLSLLTRLFDITLSASMATLGSTIAFLRTLRELGFRSFRKSSTSLPGSSTLNNLSYWLIVHLTPALALTH